MRALSILALVLSLLFFSAVISEPIFAAAQKSSNNGKNSGGDKNQEKKEQKEQDKAEKEQNKEEKNLNKEQNKEQHEEEKEQRKEEKEQNKEQNKEEKNLNKEQNKEKNKPQEEDENDDPEMDHEMTCDYENMIGSLPIFGDMKFSVDKISLELQWNGNDNTSANDSNYRAKIEEGVGQITLEGVKIGETEFGSIIVQIKSIEDGLFNEHTPANENAQPGIYLRAKSIDIKIGIDYMGNSIELDDLVLEHIMIKIQDGELQFIKLANDDLADQYLAPPSIKNKQYTTFGKIKSAN